MKKFFKTYGFRIIAWIIVIATIISLYIRFFKLKQGFDIHNIQYSPSDVWIITVVILLMLLNWSFEAIKWKIATQYLQSISFLTALKGVFMGVSVSLLFPNRTGEFLGKVWVLNKENRIKGIFASMLTSLAQLLITLLLGIIGLNLFDFEVSFVKNYHLLFSVALFIVIIILYFLIPVLTKYFETILPKKIIAFITFLKSYSYKNLAKIVFISFVRYAVFLLQLYLLFRFFGNEIDFMKFIGLAFAGFLLTTIIPTTSLSELFVRNQIGLLLFSENITSDESIVAVFTLLWIINIGIPAIIGLFISITIKN